MDRCICLPSDGPEEALRCPVHAVHAEKYLADRAFEAEVHEETQRRLDALDGEGSYKAVSAKVRVSLMRERQS